jgi:hypothetical protein
VDTTESIASAPLPTARTLRMRRSLPYQLVRLVAINIKMIKIITRGHG